MVFLRISHSSETTIEAIARLLLQENLVMDVNIKRNIDRVALQGDQLVTSRIFLLTAKSRSVMFPTVNKRISEAFAHDLPELYSLPIVHMDWDQAKLLNDRLDIKAREAQPAE